MFNNNVGLVSQWKGIAIGDKSARLMSSLEENSSIFSQSLRQGAAKALEALQNIPLQSDSISDDESEEQVTSSSVSVSHITKTNDSIIQADSTSTSTTAITTAAAKDSADQLSSSSTISLKSCDIYLLRRSTAKNVPTSTSNVLHTGFKSVEERSPITMYSQKGLTNTADLNAFFSKIL